MLTATNPSYLIIIVHSLELFRLVRALAFGSIATPQMRLSETWKLKLLSGGSRPPQLSYWVSGLKQDIPDIGGLPPHDVLTDTPTFQGPAMAYASEFVS